MTVIARLVGLKRNGACRFIDSRGRSEPSAKSALSTMTIHHDKVRMCALIADACCAKSR